MQKPWLYEKWMTSNKIKDPTTYVPHNWFSLKFLKSTYFLKILLHYLLPLEYSTNYLSSRLSWKAFL